MRWRFPLGKIIVLQGRCICSCCCSSCSRVRQQQLQLLLLQPVPASTLQLLLVLLLLEVLTVSYLPSFCSSKLFSVLHLRRPFYSCCRQPFGSLQKRKQ